MMFEFLQRPRFIGVYIAGQLGNQLFQRAAIEYVVKMLNVKYLKPFVLMGEQFPHTHATSGIQISNALKIEDRLCGFLLSRGLRETLSNRERIIYETSLFLLRIFLLIRYQTLFQILVSTSIHQSPNIDEIINGNRSVFLIGYFQDFFWQRFHRDIHTTILELLPKRSEEKIADAIVFHLRLTDYLTSSQLGNLSLKYYNKVIEEEFKENSHNILIYVITDDKELASEKLRDFDIQAEVLGPSELDSYEAFDFLKRAEFKIIANSSFSWWAAYLGTEYSSRTVYPVPWFRFLDGIRNFPENWNPQLAIWDDV